MNIELPEKLYYSIGEVASAFGVNTSLIRFWEKEFPQIQPKKNKKGNRLFTVEDVTNLKIIYHLVKERGYTLEGARVALNENKNTEQKVKLIFRMEKIKKELIEIKHYLDNFDDK